MTSRIAFDYMSFVDLQMFKYIFFFIIMTFKHRQK